MRNVDINVKNISDLMEHKKGTYIWYACGNFSTAIRNEHCPGVKSGYKEKKCQVMIIFFKSKVESAAHLKWTSNSHCSRDPEKSCSHCTFPAWILPCLAAEHSFVMTGVPFWMKFCVLLDLWMCVGPPQKSQYHLETCSLSELHHIIYSILKMTNIKT